MALPSPSNLNLFDHPTENMLQWSLMAHRHFKTNSNKDDATAIVDEAPIKKAAELLRVDPAALKSCLLIRKIVVGKEVTETPLKVHQACDPHENPVLKAWRPDMRHTFHPPPPCDVTQGIINKHGILNSPKAAEHYSMNSFQLSRNMVVWTNKSLMFLCLCWF